MLNTTETTTKKKRQPRKLPKVISREAVDRLFKGINTRCPTGLRNRTALEIMYRCGLRVSEACHLSPDDIDFKQGFIYVQQGKGNKDRMVPMDLIIQNWCRKWFGTRPKGSQWFICTLKGGQVDDRYFRQVLERLSAKAGVYINDNHQKKPVHPHTLRHCYATELIEDGFNIAEVKELLGHSSIATTQKYLSVRPSQLAEKIRKRTTGD